MKRFVSLFLLLAIVSTGKLAAQDTLPNFTLVEHGEKITISWVNPYPSVIQLNVQRSFDSIRNFSTVYSALTPQLPQNGFTDSKMPTNRIFYRIFYVMEGGSYFFTEARRVGAPSSNGVSSRDIRNPNLLNLTANEKRLVTIQTKDAVYKLIPAYLFKNFRDSILKLTKDTLFAVNDSVVMLRPYLSKEGWRPSMFVYSNKDGFINISLPLVQQKKYHIRFYEDDGSFLFEIPRLLESPVIVDKSNFVHSGWFQFELYEDDKLKEKNKFYLPKDF